MKCFYCIGDYAVWPGDSVSCPYCDGKKVIEARLGRHVLLAQLKEMTDNEQQIEFSDTADFLPELDNLDEFEVPEDMVPAFAAYVSEFFCHQENIVGPRSVFYNDIEGLYGLINKYYAIFEPIVDLLECKQGLKLDLTITPDWDTVQVMITTKEHQNGMSLALPVVIYQSCIDPGNPLFTWQTPDGVYTKLEKMVKQLEGNIKIAWNKASESFKEVCNV